MAASDPDGSIDAFTLFAAGPGRSLGDVDPGGRGTGPGHGPAHHKQARPRRLGLSVPVPDTWERG